MRRLPNVAELVVFDNSAEGDPARGVPPRPRLILQLREDKLVAACGLAEVPNWAKPIFIAGAGPHLTRSCRPRPPAATHG